MNASLISVFINTYNHERYIEQAVISAIEQDFPAADCEILVVDDGSTDRTPEIARKFAPRVRLLTKKNGGQASAFNAAYSEMRGEIVAFLDGDDWFAPGKLTAVLEVLDQHPEAAAVGHGFYEFRDETKEIRIRVPERLQFLRATTPDTACEAFRGWPTHVSRHNLATFGGNPLKAFRTEMRSFHLDFENPSFAYRLFKYLIVAPAALLLSPRRFYKMREWYAQRNLIPVRERLAKSSIVHRQLQLPRQ